VFFSWLGGFVLDEGMEEVWIVVTWSELWGNGYLCF
jgi:hypothetical protein